MMLQTQSVVAGVIIVAIGISILPGQTFGYSGLENPRTPTADIRGIPSAPPHTRPTFGEFVGDVNLYDGNSRLELPLYTLQGRGSVALPIKLIYNSNIYEVEGKTNEEVQAPWVGLGWALEVPYIFGQLYTEADGEELMIPEVTLTLYWDGIGDPIDEVSSDVFKMAYRKYWRVQRTRDQSGWLESFTLTDLNGTKYTFAHRRRTYLTLWNEQSQKIDELGPVPYRWDLTKIEDVSGQNSITITYTDENAAYGGSTYTQASYLDRITDDAGGRYLEFSITNRTDYPSNPSDPCEVYEKKRLSQFVLVDSGTTKAKFTFTNNSYFSSGSTQKLKLDAVQRKHPTGGTDLLPSWKFTYRSSSPNLYALQVLTLPTGGTRTFTYVNKGSAGDAYRLSAVENDRKMGGSAESTAYTVIDSVAGYIPGYHKVKVVPPGSIGWVRYEMITEQGRNTGSLVKMFTHDQSGILISKVDHTLADTTTVRRGYSETRSVVYAGGDSIVTQTNRDFCTINGLVEQQVQQVSPYQGRTTVTPESMETYWTHLEIDFAAQMYSWMDTLHTHQISAVYSEVVYERALVDWHVTQIPIRASWATYASEDSVFFYPEKRYVWIGSDVAVDTTYSGPTTIEKCLVHEIVSMDNYGHVLEEKDGEGRITKYYYGSNDTPLSNDATGLAHMYLTGVRKLKGTSDDDDNDLITRTRWDDGLGLVLSVADANDSTSFVYDDYGRLVFTRNQAGQLVQRTDRAYSRILGGNDTFSSSQPNYERSVRFFTYGGTTDSTHTTVFTDGLGRALQTQTRYGTSDLVQSVGFYSDGALRATYTPYYIQNSSHAYHSTAGYANKDSTKYEYESDPRRRIAKTIHPPMDSAQRYQTTVSYGIGTLNGQKYTTVTVTDENNIEHHSWLNRDGSVFKSDVGGYFAAQTWRDALGRTTKVLPPRTSQSSGSALRSDLIYGPPGLETERAEPDQGSTYTVYNRSLQPIYMQEAAYSSANDFWATRYDSFGRPIRVGLEDQANTNWFKYTPTAVDTSYGGGASEWRKIFAYDTNPFGSGTTYARGRLTKTIGNWDTDSSEEFEQLYQYDQPGRITKMRSNVVGSLSKDTEYEYDSGGRLRKVTFASGTTAAFYVWYDYDSVGRLWKIYHNTTNSKPSRTTALYYYNARGQISSQYMDNSMVSQTYSYNPRGQLVQINDPNFLGLEDYWGLELGYDLKVTGGSSTGWGAQRNGNISQMKWAQKLLGSGTALYYTFGYNSRDHITKADCSSNGYDVSSYSYDDNGNLSGLNRGTAWTYYYDGDEVNTNRLDNVSSLTGDDNWDYDASGRQTKDTNGHMTSASYWYPGAAFHELTMSGGTLKMRYDSNNQRVQKIVEGGITTTYFRDLAGNVLAVYEGSTIEERYVWGPTGLVAIVKGDNNDPQQYLTLNDHLGSIRVVLHKEEEGEDPPDDDFWNQIDAGGGYSWVAVAAYDYYPFGKTLRSTVVSDGDSRFKFQGKEYDLELGLNLYYFEARFYRPDIGRFAAPDPLRQGWSYYAFCANNPLRFIDPTGLSEEEYEEGWTQPIARDIDWAISRATPGRQPWLDASNEPWDWGVTWQMHYLSLNFGTDPNAVMELDTPNDLGIVNSIQVGPLPSHVIEEIRRNWTYNTLFSMAACMYGMHIPPAVARVNRVLEELAPSIWAVDPGQLTTGVTALYGRVDGSWAIALVLENILTDGQFWPYWLQITHECYHIYAVHYDKIPVDDDVVNPAALEAIRWIGMWYYSFGPS